MNTELPIRLIRVSERPRVCGRALASINSAAVKEPCSTVPASLFAPIGEPFGMLVTIFVEYSLSIGNHLDLA
jgi:hypothetical protein